jgi:hypothetical protein
MLQETLDTLRKAMANTRIMCAVMLDTKVRQAAAAAACNNLGDGIAEPKAVFTAVPLSPQFVTTANSVCDPWTGPGDPDGLPQGS